MMLIVLSIILFVLMLIFGGERGLISFYALVGNIVVLLFCLYGMSWGISPILITVVCSAAFIFLTLFYQNGNNLKTYTAAIAVLVVEVVLIALVLLCVYKGHAAGYSEVDMFEDNATFLSADIAIDMKLVLVAVLLVGTLGSIMDTAVAIASSMHELHVNNPDFSKWRLIVSGIHVGKDIMGTTVNTLFFACLGETMMLTILFIKFKYTIAKLMNSKAFFQEICLVLMANIGCILIIPITILLFCFLYKSEHKLAAKLRSYCEKAALKAAEAEAKEAVEKVTTAK